MLTSAMSFREQRLAPLPMTFLHFVEPKMACLRRSHSFAGYVPFELNGASAQGCETATAQESPHDDGEGCAASVPPQPRHVEYEEVAAASAQDADGVDANNEETSPCEAPSSSQPDVAETSHRSVRICNLRADVTRTSLVEAIDRLGFSGQYELCTLCVGPTGGSVGHAILSFLSAASAYKFQVKWHGQATIASLSRVKSKPERPNVVANVMEVQPTCSGSQRQPAQKPLETAKAAASLNYRRDGQVKEHSQEAPSSTASIKPASTKATMNLSQPEPLAQAMKTAALALRKAQAMMPPAPREKKNSRRK